MQRRDLVTAIILTIVTCGIYGIYWMIVLTDDVNEASHDNGTSGALAFVLTLITCGIYGLYWAYTLGEKISKIKRTNDSMGLIYLLLELFGLNIVVLALAQNDLNKSIEDHTNSASFDNER